jgi:hypothetical protein
MSKITITVDGKELKFFDSFSFSSAIDAGGSSISFKSFTDISTFDYKKVEVERNKVLIFTGEIVNKEIPDTIPPEPFTYKALTLTHILFESTLPTTAYPLQLAKSTLKEIVEYICSFFEITVIFDQSTATEAKSKSKLAYLGLDKTAGEIINDLVTEEGLILSHDADGSLVIMKKIEQNEIKLQKYTANNKSFDLTKFFHNYIALGQAPIDKDADIQAIATFDNIDKRRNTTKIQDSGGVSTIEKKAAGMRSDSLKSVTQDLSFNNFFCNVGDYVIIDDLKLIVNSLDYSFNATGEVASISLFDSKIYERE